MSKRRAAGSGAVYPWRRRNVATGKLEQVGWVGMVDLGIVDGKRRRQALYAPMDQKKALTERVTAAQKAKNDGLSQYSGRLTVAQWLSSWLAAKESGAKEMRPRTMEHYRLIITKHIVPYIGHKLVAKLSPADVDQMLGTLRKSGLSARSCHHVRAVLRNALHVAMRDGKVSRNVASLTEAIPVAKPDRRAVITFSDQVAAFLDAVEADRLSAMYVVTLALGLRLGEVTGLRWSDVDLDAGILRVTHALQWIRPIGEKAAAPRLVAPKTEESKRVLELSEPLVEALRTHQRQQLQEIEAAGGTWLNGWHLVFTGSHGEPLRAETIGEQLRAILKTAGLPRIRFHDLRHANASLLLTAGVDEVMVSKLLGHSNPTTTRNIYQHVLRPMNEKAKRAQAAILERAL